MWGLETIQQINQMAATQARQVITEPYVPRSLEEVENYPPWPFPHIGDYVAPGWEETSQTWFIDTSGWGSDEELALSTRQFREALYNFVKDHPGWGFAYISMGRSQAVVRAFAPLNRN